SWWCVWKSQPTKVPLWVQPKYQPSAPSAWGRLKTPCGGLKKRRATVQTLQLSTWIQACKVPEGAPQQRRSSGGCMQGVGLVEYHIPEEAKGFLPSRSPGLSGSRSSA